jgi:hypothetical protein
MRRVVVMDAILKCNSCGEEVRLDVGLVDDRSQVIAFCASHQEHATGGFSLLIPRSVLTALTTTHHEPGLAKPPTGITLAHAVWGSTEPVTVHVVVADGSSLCGTPRSTSYGGWMTCPGTM